MPASETYTRALSVIEHNRACTNPFALKGDGRFLSYAEMTTTLLRFREHTFLRAIANTGNGRRAFYVFAEDGYGERRFTVTTFLLLADESTDRWSQTLPSITLAFLYLGLNCCPLDARWEVIPLPDGFMP